MTPASAQVGANATITINVLDGLSIFRHSHLRFGERISGTGVHTVAVTSPNVGKFEVVGSRANNVSITLTPPSALANQSGQTLPYTWAAAYNMSADNPGASTPFATTTANGLRLADNSGGYGGNIRRGWVYIHGSIDVGTVPAGNYTAVFSIQAVYN